MGHRSERNPHHVVYAGFVPQKREVEVRAGQAATADFTLGPVGDPRLESRVDRAAAPVAPREMVGKSWFTVKLRYKQPASSTSRVFERVVRNETGTPSIDFRCVLALARGARGADEEGYRAEFIRLVETAATLATSRPPSGALR